MMIRGYQKLAILLLITFSCDGLFPSSNEGIYSSFDISSSTKVIFFIPTEGCNGCVDASLTYLKNNQDTEKVRYVLSGLSKKDILIKLNEFEIGLSESIHLDIHGKSKSYGIVNGYPTLVYLSGNTLKKVVLSADNIESDLLILNSNIDVWGKENNVVFGYDEVDVKPYYPQGMNAFYEFIQQIASTQSTSSAKAVIEFTIAENGTIQNIVVLKNNGCCGEEFIQSLMASPEWIPGKKNGKTVSTKLILPLRFI